MQGLLNQGTLVETAKRIGCSLGADGREAAMLEAFRILEPLLTPAERAQLSRADDLVRAARTRELDPKEVAAVAAVCGLIGEAVMRAIAAVSTAKAADVPLLFGRLCGMQLALFLGGLAVSSTVASLGDVARNHLLHGPDWKPGELGGGERDGGEAE